MIKQLAILELLALPLLFCNHSPVQQNKNVVVLFDLSLSTQTDEIRESYSRDMRKVMDAMKPGDVLVAAQITSQSINQLEFCLQHTFAVFNPGTDNDLKKRALWARFLKKQARVKDSLLTIVDSTLHSHSKIRKTEIMGALQLAARIFRTYNMPKRVLVVFSDMLEDSQFYRFERQNLTPQRTEAIIKNETKNQRLPDLQGVKVYVTGARSKNRQRFLQVQNFWLKYFAASGAHLAADDYGSLLIRFNE